MLVYFARPISNYKSLQDQRDLALLKQLGFEVVNPDKETYQKEYLDLGMDVFLNEVKKCEILVFRSFVDGNISSGVFKEIIAAQEADISILELPTITSKRVLSVEDTRAYLTLLGQR